MNKMGRKSKIISISIIIILLLSSKIPSFARYKNRINTSLNTWSGQVALKYKKGNGTIENPYIISNGEELAYFSSQLENNNYKNEYLKISNDIVLNKGKFKYEQEKLTYEIDGTTYYVKENKYYDTEEYINEIGTINVFPSLKNFEGNLDGDYHSIYGLYNYNQDSALFTNLKGEITSLYIENSVVIGTNTAALLADKITDSTLKNILVDGYVINNSTNEKIIDKSIYLEPVTIGPNQTLEISIPKINNHAKKTKIIGKYTQNNNIELTINDQENTLGTIDSLLYETNKVTLKNNSIDEITVTFSDIKYLETYDYSISAGVIALANNSELKNIINKANINGTIISSGIIGIDNNTTIENAYNTGTITSENLSSAIIGIVDESSITLNKIYNAGTLSGNTTGLINTAENSTITLNDSFITTNDKIINQSNNSQISGDNNYYTYENTGILNSTLTTEENLKNKEYLSNYNEFNQEITEENVWVFEYDNYPVLYIDDILNQDIELYVNTYTWDSYTPIPDQKRITDSITFSLNEKNELNQMAEKYYYIKNSNQPLTKEQLGNVTWVNYTDIVKIKEEGYYIIYVKTVDENNHVNYINSDILILDNSPSEIELSMDGLTWTNTNNNEIYINTNKNITINAIDNLSGISKIEYYISQSVLNKEQIEEINNWNIYESPIELNQIGTYIIYAKATNNCNYTNYASTSLIIYDGYNISISPLGLEQVENNITKNSKLKVDIQYNNSKQIQNPVHNIITNKLKENTKMTLIDKTNNKVYEHIITKEDNQNSQEIVKYPFTLFKEVGKINGENYIETTVTNENYTLIIDFETADIKEDYKNINLYINIEKNNQEIRPTLESSKQTINIYSDDSYEIKQNISTNFTNEIYYNTDSETVIPISTTLTQKTLDSTIYDTTMNDKTLGLIIKLEDANGITVDNEYLKNIIFKVNNTIYTPDNQAVIHINLNTNQETETDLTIITHETSAKLRNGTYYLKIKGTTSYDGIYSTKETNEISIPVIIENMKKESNYKFDVKIDDSKRIIEKQDGLVKLDFYINKENLINNNVKIKMYKKDNLTAYNQDYTLIDLQNYTSNILDKYMDNVYYITRNMTSDSDMFTLNLNTQNLEKTSYKIVFELYENNKKISTVNKYFVIR